MLFGYNLLIKQKFSKLIITEVKKIFFISYLDPFSEYGGQIIMLESNRSCPTCGMKEFHKNETPCIKLGAFNETKNCVNYDQ